MGGSPGRALACPSIKKACAAGRRLGSVCGHFRVGTHSLSRNSRSSRFILLSLDATFSLIYYEESRMDALLPLTRFVHSVTSLF